MHTATLPLWNDAAFKVDNHSDSLNTILFAAEPTAEVEFFNYIVATWISSIQESLMDGLPGVAYAKLHAFYLLARVHKTMRPALLEAVVDHTRALDFVLVFLAKHPEGQAKLAAEAKYMTDSGFTRMLIMIASAPDRFSRDEITLMFKRVSRDALHIASPGIA